MEAECRYYMFYLLKKAKNVLDANNNNFYFLCVVKVIQCTFSNIKALCFLVSK